MSETAEGTQSTEGTEQTPPANEGGEGKGGGDLTVALRKEREEKAQLKAELDAMKKAQEDARVAELQSIEDLKAELSKRDQAIAELQNNISTERKTSKLRSMLGEAHNPDDVLAFVNVAELPEDGDFEAVVNGLKESKPYLFKSGEEGGQQGRRTAAPQGGSSGSDEPHPARKIFGLG